MITIAALAALLYLLFHIWMRRLWTSTSCNSSFYPPISIVIVARNESHNISACLLSIAKNDYPRYEIILIDDHSSDQTIHFAKGLGLSNLKIISLQDYSLEHPTNSYKKRGQEIGIQNANFEYILTTDADCMVGDKWIASMASSMNEAELATGIILITGNNTILQRFQIFEMSGTMVATHAGIKSNSFYSANAANMIFKKSLFQQFQLERSDSKIATGDDMFFIQWAALQNKRVIFNNSHKATVTTMAESNWASFITQRVRWASKTKYYTHLGLHVFFSAIWIYQFLILLSLIYILIYDGPFWLFLLLVISKITADATILSINKVYARSNPLTWVFMPLLHSMYIGALPVISFFKNSYAWKGRNITYR